VSMQSAAAARGRAPGKVILLGEHAVVYDRPALATSIGRYVDVQVFSGAEARANAAPEVPGPVLARATQLAGLSPCTVRVTTAADLPVGVGLGSSAALSVALVRALADYAGTALDAAGVCARAFELEKLFHGFPSGIDNTVCAVGGLLRFQHGQHVAPVHARRPLVLVVAVGCAARATHAAVTALRRRWQVDRRGYEAIFDEIAALVDAAEVAVSGGDLHELGRLMNDNHRLLHRIGVSTEELERS
jgi:mevalonate kinase